MRTIPKSKGLAPAVAGAGLIVALSLSACAPALPDAGVDGDSSTVTILLGDTVNSIDPALAFSVGARQAVWMVYEPLVRYDAETGDAAPGLAESWDFTPTSASFVIREGAKCADGSEITAGTVARNFERLKDPATNAPLVDQFFGSADFQVTFDDAERSVDVAMTQEQPFLGVEPSFTSLGIACDSALEDPTVFDTGSDGSGAYTVTEYVNGSHVSLARNDDYAWGPDGFSVEELPERVELKIVADPNTQSNLLLGGNADAALLGGDQLPRFENEPGFTHQFADTAVTMLMFNERDEFATHDEAVRKALVQSLDFEELSGVQTGGIGYAPDFLRAPGELCVDPDAISDAMPTGGIEAGQETLEAAGYEQGADGIYAKDGVPLSVGLLQMELSSAAVELVTSAWGELGVEVSVDNRDVGQAVDTLYTGTGWGASFVGMSVSQPTGLRPFFVGPAAPEGPNFGATQNPTYMQKQGEASAVGGADSCPLWIEAETAIVERADWVPAIAVDNQWVMREGVSFFNDSAQIDPLTLRKK